MRPRARGSSRRGQALTEFALVLPLVVVLFFGVIEFGRFMFAYETLNNAVHEGVRYAIVHGGSSACPSGPPAADSYECDRYGENVVDRVKHSAFSLSEADLEVTVCWGVDCLAEGDGSSNARGTPVTVRGTYTWRPLVTFVLLPSISITGTSTDAINY